jgi:acetyl-CoA carboxylase biotin carboxylase subunit
VFRKVLVANRGEIAVRILRACRELGIASVAVYSDVDRGALHVRQAGEAYPIGPAPARDSYLNIERLLDTAKRCGADAIHPGYGFLSENPAFAAACEQAGIKFVGPTAAAMRRMGSKTDARATARLAGAPLVPGSPGEVTSLEDAKQAARTLGYPVMLKASAGGGGKGMRLVRSADELPSHFAAARSEAERAFGDPRVYLEKLIVAPRHVEVQVLGDEHGNVIHLGERECSLQRRHQKVLEESPSPIVDAAMRARLGDTALRIAGAAGYTNAGTVEFLVDRDRNFYFLEMNTRLQVEHPVTEAVTGLDLVQLQLRIAAGERLPLRQEEVTFRGHAIECRIYAEDPENNFMPSPGRITRLITPSGPGIREDSGIYEGWAVPLDYDPLLSKLVAFGAHRNEAIARLQRALGESFIGGIRTNLGLFRRILRDAQFVAGDFDTGTLDRVLAEKSTAAPDGDATRAAAIAAAWFTIVDSAAASNGRAPSQPESAWKKAARQEGLRSE